MAAVKRRVPICLTLQSRHCFFLLWALVLVNNILLYINNLITYIFNSYMSCIRMSV